MRIVKDEKGRFEIFIHEKGKRGHWLLRENGNGCYIYEQRAANREADRIYHEWKSGGKPAQPAAPVPGTGISLKTYWETTYSARHLASLRPGTQQLYKTLWFKVEPVLGRYDLRQISEAVVIEFVKDLKAETFMRGGNLHYLTRDAVRNRVAVLQSILAEAAHERLIERNPVTKYIAEYYRDVPRAPQVQPFSDSEIVKLLGVIKEHYPRYHAFFNFLFRTGCRVGEAIGLMWADVDLKTPVVRIHQTYSHNVLGPLKAGESHEVEILPSA